MDKLDFSCQINILPGKEAKYYITKTKEKRRKSGRKN